MATTNNGLTAAEAAADEAKPLGLKFAIPESGCQSSSVGSRGFFCQYVEEVFLHNPAYGKTPMDRAKLLATGGLKIYTTLNPQDQQAAHSAVNYVEPAHSTFYNPGRNADTEAVVQPGTGQIMAIAENRPYGTDHGETEINYAVNTAYGGSSGVQTGSSSKLFTLITALKQGMPFGATMHAPGSTTVTGYTNCQGGPAGYYQGQPGAFNVTNAEGPQSDSNQSLYTGTVQSVNVYFAVLEQQVGLCNVVNTAASMGLTRADGTSLLKRDGQPGLRRQHPLVHAGLGQRRAAVHGGRVRDRRGARHVLRARRHRQDPDNTGKSLSVPSANCHRVFPTVVADAVNYILQGVLTSGTAAPGRPGRPVRSPGGGQDRYLQRGGRRRHAVRRLRRLHARPGGVRVGVQPDLPDRQDDDRLHRLLPAGERQPVVPEPDVRGERARVDLAHDVRPRRPRQGHLLRAGPAGQSVLEPGQRPGRPAAEEAEEGPRSRPRRWRRRWRRRRR